MIFRPVLIFAVLMLIACGCDGPGRAPNDGVQAATIGTALTADPGDTTPAAGKTGGTTEGPSDAVAVDDLPPKPSYFDVVTPDIATLPGCDNPAVMNDMGPPLAWICPEGWTDCSYHGDVPTRPHGKPCVHDECWDPPKHVCSGLFGSSMSIYCKPDGTLCCQWAGCPPCGWVLCSTSGAYHDDRCPAAGNPYYDVVTNPTIQPAECAAYGPGPEAWQQIWCMDEYPDWCSEGTHADDVPTHFPAGVVPVWMKGSQTP